MFISNCIIIKYN